MKKLAENVTGNHTAKVNNHGDTTHFPGIKKNKQQGEMSESKRGVSKTL